MLRSRNFAYAAFFASAVVLIDQFSKALALHYLGGDIRIPLLGDLFGLQLAFNSGAAFSLGSEFTGVITIFVIAATAVLTRAATRARSLPWAIGIGLVWGGAIGNLLDRLLAPPGFGIGHVTDFLAYGQLFIGNLADVAVFAGFAILGVTMLRHRAHPTPSSAPELTPAQRPEHSKENS